LLVPGVRAGQTGGEASIGVRAKPRDVRDRGCSDHGAVARRSEVDGHCPSAPGCDAVEASTRGHGVQPRTQRAAALETRDPTPRSQQRVLQGIVGVVGGPQHAVAVGVQLVSKWFDEPSERGGVAVARPG